MYETRLVRVFSLFAGCLVALGVQAFALQVVRRETVLAEHEKRVHGRFVLAPRRGEILWADGTPAASNEPGFSVAIDLDASQARRRRCGVCGAVAAFRREPAACRECRSPAPLAAVAPADAELAHLLGTTPAEYDEALVRADASRAKHPWWRYHELVKEVDREAALAIALASPRLPGVAVRAASGRTVDPAAAGVVGGTRLPHPEDVEELSDPARAGRVYTIPEIYSMRFGRTGLEASFDERLRGDPGTARRLARKAGRVRAPEVLVPVADGAVLWTTLRRDVQVVAEEVVAAAAGDAAAVVLDLRDGAVVAIASKSGDGLHHAVASIRPGSVFKLATSLALLESGVSLDETVSCAGFGRLPDGRKCACDGVHGSVSFRDAFAHSCNAYFATMADRAGPAAMERACAALGLDSNPSAEIHLPGTPCGLDPYWRRRSPWYPPDMAKIGIGQGKALVSPLQVALAFGRVAAGGRILVPYLVEDERPLAAGVDPSIARWSPVLSEAARRVVTSGTGSGVRELFAVEAAGKSGTGDVNAAGSSNNAWFVAFAPATDPRYVAVVVYEKVPGHGAAMAGPPVARLLAQALR